VIFACNTGGVHILAVLGYEARVERGIILTVEAVDWNCPQHITPRYSKAEVDGMIAPLLDEIQALKAQIASASTLQNK
jgi:uncharacterized protein